MKAWEHPLDKLIVHRSRCPAKGWTEVPMDKKREHLPHGRCWCQPTVESVDPESGVKVWLHRGLQ